MRRSAIVVMLVALLAVSGCRAAQPPSGPARTSSGSENVASGTATSASLPESGYSPSKNATVPVVAETPAALAVPPVNMTVADLRRSLVTVLDPLTEPSISVDVARVLLERPGVSQAISRRLQKRDDVGFPGTASDVHFLTTTVFRPCGALPFTEDTSRFRVFGVVTDMTWRMLGLLPSAHSSNGAWAGWLDIELDPEPKVVGLVNFGDLYSFENPDDAQVARLFPGWVVDRIYATPTVVLGDDETEELADPGSLAATVRLLGSWTTPRVSRRMTTALPARWTPAPHNHAGITGARQLSASEVNRVFQVVGMRQVDSQSLYGDKDIVGPGADGPIRADFTTYNAIDDYSVLPNSSTRRAIKVMGFSRYSSAVFKGSRLFIDLVADDRFGGTPTIIHCEIDWKSMTIRRAVPFGPLSPY